jgi:hypothetical protein
MNTGSEKLIVALETIESGYEFLLAYAAQGRDDDSTSGGDHGVRNYLNDMNTALDTLQHTQFPALDQAMQAVLAGDAKKAQAPLALVLKQSAISSQLVDNLNASIHLRALLTDLFLIDEALKASKA